TPTTTLLVLNAIVGLLWRSCVQLRPLAHDSACTNDLPKLSVLPPEISLTQPERNEGPARYR
ncbi:MAG TPA: hypothetical protein VJW23_04305, partial [Propionibacteriaceae bacterium]|nr:hypothetical protein [Propionibacteriaceae bacterium]